MFVSEAGLSIEHEQHRKTTWGRICDPFLVLYLIMSSYKLFLTRLHNKGLRARHLRTLLLFKTDPETYGYRVLFGGSSYSRAITPCVKDLLQKGFMEENLYSTNQGPFRITSAGKKLLQTWEAFKKNKSRPIWALSIKELHQLWT